MKYFRLLPFILLASVTFLVPPGMCPCWLNQDPQVNHPHPYGDPEQAHSHEYLADLAAAIAVNARPVESVSGQLLIGLLSLSGILLLIWRNSLSGSEISLPPPSPPPRELIKI